MSRKIKYGLELKLLLVKQAINGEGSVRAIAKENQINHTILDKWVSFYKAYGIEGLQLQPRQYDGDFKLTVIKTLRTEGLFLYQACIRFKLPSVSMLSNWQKKYESEGVGHFSNHVGENLWMHPIKNLKRIILNKPGSRSWKRKTIFCVPKMNI